MHKTDAANNNSGLFQDAVPNVNPGTVVDAKWLNQIQAELLNILAFYGLAPDYTQNNQVVECLVGSAAQITGAMTHASLTAGTGSFAPLFIQTFLRMNLYGRLTNSTGSTIAAGTQVITLDAKYSAYGATSGQVGYAQCVAFSGSALIWMPLILTSGASGGSMSISLGAALPNGYTLDLLGVTWITNS